MKAIYKTDQIAEERLTVINVLSHPGAAFRVIRIENTTAVPHLAGEGNGGVLHYEPGLFIKEVEVHVLPLLGLVQGKTATLGEEDTYALFLEEGNQLKAVNVGCNRPDHYLLLDYSQFEKLKSETERINFWVAITGQTSWPLVKLSLYEGYDKLLDRSVFTGYRVNNGKPTIGHYHYSTVELARLEKTMFDTGVFLPHINKNNKAIVAEAENLAMPA
jgi:hypothetical protein